MNNRHTHARTAQHKMTFIDGGGGGGSGMICLSGDNSRMVIPFWGWGMKV